MTNLDLAYRYLDVLANKKTTFGYSGWLQPLTDSNKTKFLNGNEKNRTNETIKLGILSASADTLIGDCVCTVKSIIDDLVGIDNQTSAMRKPCPDITIKSILNDHCIDVSTDLSNILIGEFMVYGDLSHCGIYMGIIDGKRMIAESTYRWENGLQLIDMDRVERKGKWKYHGKLWEWMDYTYKGTSIPNSQPSPKVNTSKLKAQVTALVKAKQGDANDYVAEIQKVLIARGFPCGGAGADGIFGNATMQAVQKFQAANKLTADGIVGYDTITALIDD